MNRLVFKFASDYDSAAIVALAAAVQAVVVTDYIPICGNDVGFINTHVRGLENLIDLEATNGTGASTGSASGANLPANASLCVTLHTGHTGRSARGRFYAFPTVIGSTVSSDSYTGAYAIAVETLLVDIFAAAVGASWTPVVLSRFTAGAVRSVGVGFPITTAIARNTLIDSQRNRLQVGH